MNLTDLVKNAGIEPDSSCSKSPLQLISQLSVPMELEQEKITLPMDMMAQQYDLNMNQQVTQIFQTTQNISLDESPTEITPPVIQAEVILRKCTCSKGQCKKMYCVCLRNG